MKTFNQKRNDNAKQLKKDHKSFRNLHKGKWDIHFTKTDSESKGQTNIYQEGWDL